MIAEKTEATVRLAAGAFCQNIRAFVEAEHAGRRAVVLRTDRYAYVFHVSALEVCECEAGSVSAQGLLYMRTQQCCRDLLRAERATEVLP